jgi:RNA polymerase sigma-B factor
MPLARTLAARYARTQEPFEDLFQVASLGLVKAAGRYDPDRGAAFSSYALPTILGELKRHFRDKGRSIHLPRGLQELVMRVQAAEEQLSTRTGRSPTVIEIAEHLQIDTESVLEALEAITARNASSLDAPLEAEPGEEAATQHDMIGREDEGYALVETSSSLAGAVQRLRRTDRQVLELRLNRGMTQSEIAKQIGVSQMQVSRILRRATDQLRETIAFGDSPSHTSSTRDEQRARPYGVGDALQR